MIQKYTPKHPGDRLAAMKWRLDFIIEMFSSIDPERFHLSETGIAGLYNSLDDIRDEIEAVAAAL